MKIYEGKRASDEMVFVTVDGRNLDMRLDLRNHSPTGFEWGYGGSGPSQLALAILADHSGDEVAQKWYQPFKWRMISSLPRDGGFRMTGDDVANALKVLIDEGRNTQ